VELGRDEVMKLHDGDVSVQRGADRLECGLENLLVVAPRILLGLPYLRDVHSPADLGGAVHDQPERVPVLDVHACVDGVVHLPVHMAVNDPGDGHRFPFGVVSPFETTLKTSMCANPAATG